MLSLNLTKGDYITISDNIVVQVFPDGGRATLRVDAPREIPVVRGKLAEKAGVQKPDAIAATEAFNYQPRSRGVNAKIRSERYFEKLDRLKQRKKDAMSAIETMQRCLGEIESPEVRRVFREQLERVVPLAE